MAMLNMDDLKRRRGSPVNSIHAAAGKTKEEMTAEGDKFEISAGEQAYMVPPKEGAPQ